MQLTICLMCKVRKKKRWGGGRRKSLKKCVVGKTKFRRRSVPLKKLTLFPRQRRTRSRFVSGQVSQRLSGWAGGRGGNPVRIISPTDDCHRLWTDDDASDVTTQWSTVHVTGVENPKKKGGVGEGETYTRNVVITGWRTVPRRSVTTACGDVFSVSRCYYTSRAIFRLLWQFICLT